MQAVANARGGGGGVAAEHFLGRSASGDGLSLPRIRLESARLKSMRRAIDRAPVAGPVSARSVFDLSEWV